MDKNILKVGRYLVVYVNVWVNKVVVGGGDGGGFFIWNYCVDL